jgi:23S rRNA (uridine2552-2'-O)-methyltransferase
MSKFVVKDTFFNKAKQDGYRARSVYKLKEVQDKFSLIRKNDRVLDLGCAPGSFLQFISRLTGDQGLVVGIDILPVAPLPDKNITVLKLDIRDAGITGALLQNLSLDHFDVITCDIAPNLSGIREVDDKNVDELFEAVLNVVKDGLKRGGNFLIKSFFSESLKKTDKALKDIFRKVTIFKPTASRTVSSEIYFVCLGKK